MHKSKKGRSPLFTFSIEYTAGLKKYNTEL